MDHANLTQAEKWLIMTSSLNNLEDSTRKAKDKAGQEQSMVLEVTGVDGMNLWASMTNQKPTLQPKMKAGKKMGRTPGMKEQRTHGICLGNLLKHHGTQKLHLCR